jgi:hypothetical protein
VSDPVQWLFVVFGTGLILYWTVNLVVALRKPASWVLPIWGWCESVWPKPRITRGWWIVASLVGIAAAVGLILQGVFIWPTR